MTRARAIENSPPARASTSRFEEQLDRDGDRGGTHAVAAKVSETFFDADDGAASMCEAKMHEADGLARRTPAGPRDAGDRKRYVRGGTSQRAFSQGPCGLPADRAKIFQNPRRDPETFDFRGIGVGDEAALENVGRPRYGGDQGRQEAPRA